MTDPGSADGGPNAEVAHDWQLWVPMEDGTDRECRQCRNCPMIQTREAK